MVLSNVITNNTLDVIEIHSNSNLLLETNTQIFLNTSNILINYIPINEYIRNIVFDEAITSTIDSNNIHTEIGVSGGGPVDVTNFTTAIGETSTLEIDEIYCSGISATHTHVTTHGNSYYHYINVSAASNIYFNIGPSGNNASNIVYNNDTTEVSLSNYIYKVVNNQRNYNTETLTFPSIASGNINITNMGTYVGNKIITSKISTSNTQAFGAVEPILKFDSETAINFVSNEYPIHNVNVGSNIFLGQISLDTLIKSQLNETGMFDLTAIMSSGQDIGMELDSFTHTAGYTFEYDAEFYIYLHDDNFNDMIDAGSVDSLTVNSLTPDTSPYVALTFYGQPTGNLVAGHFYTVLGKFTNKRTGTVVENVQITGGERVATIQNVVINSITLLKEDTIRIEFVKHATQVSAWYQPEKEVKFFVQIGDSSPIVYYSPIADTTITQYLSQPVDPTTTEYYFNISSVEAGYGQDHIKIDNVSKTTLPTEIKIISNHYNDPSSTFEMSQIATLSPHTFQIPSKPLDIGVESKKLKWKHENNDSKLNDDRITYIVKQDTTIKATLNSTTKEYDLSLSSPYYGDWNVQANIDIYDLNIWSDPLPVNELAIDSISGLTFINNPRQFYFDVTISSYNVNYTISGQTLTDALQSPSPLSTNTRLYFTLNNGISGGNKTLDFTVTDNYGFTVIGSNTEVLTINLHSLSSVNFVLDTPTSYSYSFVYNGVSYTPGNPLSDGSATLAIPTIQHILSLPVLDYIFEVTIMDSDRYGFTVSGSATFTVTLPTIGTVSTSDIGPYSVKVSWNTLGTNGTPDQTPSYVNLLYKKSADSTYNNFIDISSLPNNYYTVPSLDLNTKYDFKIEKTYSNYNSIFSEITNVSTLHVTELPTTHVIDNTNTVGRNIEIDVAWTEGSSNGSATGYTIDITYIIEYKLSTSPTWIVAYSGISYNSPQTVSGLTSNRLYHIRVTKVARIEGFALNTESVEVNVPTPAIEPEYILNFRNKSLSYTDMELTWDSLGIDGDYTLNNVIIEYRDDEHPDAVVGTIIVPFNQRIEGGEVLFTIPPEEGINVYYFKLKKVYSDPSRNIDANIRVSLKMYPPYFISYSINEDVWSKHATHDLIHIRFKYDGPSGYLTNENSAFNEMELYASYHTDVDLTGLSSSISADLIFITNSFEEDADTQEHYKIFHVMRRHNPWIFILLVRADPYFTGGNPYQLQVQTTRPNKFTFYPYSNFYPSGVKEINVRINFVSAYDGIFFLQNYDDLSESSILLTGGSITETTDMDPQGKDVTITFTNEEVDPLIYYVLFSRINVTITRTYENIFHTYSIQSDYAYVPDIAALAPSITSITDSGNARTVLLSFHQNDNGNDFPLYYTIQRVRVRTGEGISSIDDRYISLYESIPVDILETQIEYLDEEMFNKVDMLIPGETFNFKITKHTKRSQTVLSTISSAYTMPNITRKVYFIGLNNWGQAGGALTIDTETTPYNSPTLIDYATFASSWYLPNATIYSNISGVYYVLNMDNGTIQSTGRNTNGLLGDGGSTPKNNLFRNVIKSDGTNLDNVTKMYIGQHVTYAVTSSLDIYTWGRNPGSGDWPINLLGHSFGTSISSTAKKNTQYSKYLVTGVNISIGGSHAVFVIMRSDEHNDVQSFGYMGYVNGTDMYILYSPIDISVITESHSNFNYNLLNPICTPTCTYFLYRGYLYAGGENTYGQLANGSHDANMYNINLCTGFSSIQGNIRSAHPTDQNIYVVTNNNSVYGIGKNVNVPNGSGGYDLYTNIVTTMQLSLTNVKKLRTTRFNLDAYALMTDNTIKFSGSINDTDVFTGFVDHISDEFNNTKPLYNIVNTDITSVYIN